MLPDEEKTVAIAKRTKKNLEFMYKAKDGGADVEEFTHLLNSMLCMVVCLREEYFKGKNVSWEDVVAKGLLPVDIQAASVSEASPRLVHHTSFSQLISNVRHGFAHNCFLLNGDLSNKITGITIWNIQFGCDDIPLYRTWQATISEAQLKELAYLFIDFICKEF